MNNDYSQRQAEANSAADRLDLAIEVALRHTPRSLDQTVEAIGPGARPGGAGGGAGGARRAALVTPFLLYAVVQFYQLLPYMDILNHPYTTVEWA